MTTKNMNRYTAIVTIETEDIDNAEKVLNERIHYDEDYGFPYKIDYNELQPETTAPGIVIDASVIRDQLDSLMPFLDDDDPKDKRILDANDRIKSMSDSNLNTIISSTDDKYAWELFNDMRDHILNSVIGAVLGTDPS